MPTYIQKRRADFSVLAAASQIVNSPDGPRKVGLQAIGGTPTVSGTMSPQADIDAATATWVAITLTSGQAIVDNVYTAFKFTGVGATAKCSVVWG